MKSNFKRNVLIGFGVSLVLLLISTTASFLSIKRLVQSKWWVDHTNQVISNLNTINQKMSEAEACQRGYLLTGNLVFLDPLDSCKAIIHRNVSEIRSMTADNEAQENNIVVLDSAVSKRLRAMDAGIRIKTAGRLVTDTQLLKGRDYTQQAQTAISKMATTEKALLIKRSSELETYVGFTPILIVIAALISLVTTMVFGARLLSDFARRVELQEALQRKDHEVNQRITIIQDIADKISQGNYKIRVGDEGKDVLGSLAGSLNKMATSLDYSFTLLSDKEWLQSRMVSLNIKMQGEQDLETLTRAVLDHLIEAGECEIGVIYLTDDFTRLKMISSYALSVNAEKEIASGEGIAGQCARKKKTIRITGIPAENFMVSFASGQVRPSDVIAVPILNHGKLMGVMELGTIGKFTDNQIIFFETASEAVGMALHVAANRLRVQELLEETQSQAEELQSQHRGLESINEELKSQSQKLQVSEEELRVQQEELLQTNTELEERTNLLEERNQMIEERNQQIQLKARELEITTKYKSEFLANMSHELRTPLNSILLLSRLLLENNERNLSKDQMESAEVIHTSGQGLLSLIDEILDLSKVEAGKMDVELAEVGVRETTNDLRALFAPVARQKNIDFEVSIDHGVPAVIETDKMRLQQILKNLISNALKFTTKGSVRLEIKSVEDNMMLFNVKDTGIGIPEEKQQLIFEAFQQADGSTRRQYGGTGLGLSISRELAKLLGGKITLSSRPGAGSEFQLALPVKRQAHAPAFGPAEAARAEVTKPMQTETLMTQDDTADKMNEVFQRIEHGLKNEPRKVLIVEENSRHAKALYYFLENFNIEPEIKTTIDDAITLLSSDDGLCVILDSGLQGDGLHSGLERVKSTPGLELLPIILFTGKALSKMEEGRIKQYANSVVVKTAHSYQRILDEVSLYLHLVEGNRSKNVSSLYKKMGRLAEVLKDKKVLIADDDVRNIFSLSKSLESVGMHILSAIDGKEALQQLTADPSVDVVLMDMMMPEMDGYDTMREIRQMSGFSKLPIIAVTAKAMSGDREKCISAGASDYITKPVDKDQLLSLLRVWLYDRN